MDCLTPDELRATVTAWHGTHALRRLYPDMSDFIKAAGIGRGVDDRTPLLARIEHYKRELSVATQWADERLAAVRHPGRSAVFEMTDEGSREVWCYGRIGLGGPVSESATFRALDRIDGPAPISVRLSSPGGVVVEAQRIVRALRDAGRPVHVVIDHCAWSAAAVIAAAGDHVAMREGATWMAHAGVSEATGTAARLRRAAKWVARRDEEYIRILAKQRRLPLRVIRQLAKAERYIEADEALRIGLVDEVLPALPPPGGDAGDTVGGSFLGDVSGGSIDPRIQLAPDLA